MSTEVMGVLDLSLHLPFFIFWSVKACIWHIVR